MTFGALTQRELDKELANRKRDVDAVLDFIQARDAIVEELKSVRGWCRAVCRVGGMFAAQRAEIMALLDAIDHLVDNEGNWIAKNERGAEDVT